MSCFNKIFERLICRQLLAFLEKYKLLYKFQFGFRERYSTILALTEITDKIRCLLDGGNYALGLFLDLKKAFDTVNHEILLYKLDHYGIRGHANNFFRSYLSNRNQFTVTGTQKSSVREITCGVPQGSVLGPILFLIYVNDLGYATGEDITRLFADDTGLFTYDKNLTTLINKSKEIYSCLFKWCLYNGLSVNYSKTSFILFHTRNKPVPRDFTDINVDGIKISRTEVIKYLGLYIDEKLTWNYHVEHLCKSLVKFFGMFKKVRYCITQKLCRQIYYAFIYSRISYGIEIYGSCTDKLLSRLQVIQNKLLKFLLKQDSRTPTSTLHYNMKILKIKHIYETNILNFVKNCLNDYYPETYRDYFTFRPQLYNMRREHLHIPFFRTNVGRASTKCKGAELWNKLSECCRSRSAYKSFKRHITQCYIKQYMP